MEKELMSDSELEQINGGYDPYGGVPIKGANAGRPYYGDPVRLVGPYYSSSYAEGPAYRAAIGWSGLYAEEKYPNRAAGFRVRQSNGADVGWAPRSSIQFI